MPSGQPCVTTRGSRRRRLRPLGGAARERGVSEGMGKRRKVPDDLMGTILSEGSGSSGGDRTFSEPRGSRGADRKTGSTSSAGEGTVSWQEQPERVGITFNLSKQIGTELDKLQRELQLEGDI